MRSQTIALVSVICAAAAFVTPAQAGFLDLSFFVDGGKWQVPHCKAPKVLTELTDARSGERRWRCVEPRSVEAPGGIEAPVDVETPRPDRAESTQVPISSSTSDDLE